MTIVHIARAIALLALALATPALRIEAPVPGKSIVGIEVPNDSPAKVRMRPFGSIRRIRLAESKRWANPSAETAKTVV